MLTALLVVTFLLLITQRVPVELTSLGVIAFLGLSGLLEPSEALSGFSSPATVAVAAMLALSAALERTGVVETLGRFFAARAGDDPSTLLLFLGIPAAISSAFMNNTAIVALTIPLCLSLARKLGRSPSELLLPISYFSILGGTCTLVGTSTNLLVDSLYRRQGGVGFGMFEITGVGLVLVAVGGTYIVLVGRRLLLKRQTLGTSLDSSLPGEFVTEVVVHPESVLAGRRLDEVFGAQRQVTVLELIREEEPLLNPRGDVTLAPADVLLLKGTAREIHELLARGRVVHGTAVSDDERVPLSRFDLRMVEAVVTPNSQFLHQRIRDLGIGRKLGVHVLALRRLGRHHQFALRDVDLRAGDVLLLQGETRALASLAEEGNVILIEGVEGTLTFSRKAPLAVGILLAVVTLAALEVAPLFLLALGGVAALLGTGCLLPKHATRALQPGVLLLLAAMIPLGQAMERSGLAADLARAMLGAVGTSNPFVLVGTFYLLTTVITEVLSNNATAVLMTPIALSAAAKLGLDPKPLLAAVMFGASASFSTPIGYQTNTMVMGPGGYVFTDFLRVGLPLNVLTWLTASVLIPLIWLP